MRIVAVSLLFSLGISVPLSAYMVKYKEDFYRLYHIHYQQYPDDCIENIYWLEKAVQADFCNPLYAGLKIPLPLSNAFESQTHRTALEARQNLR